MTTSGVTTVQLTRNEMIAASLRKLGVVAAGQTPTTEDYTNGAQAYNALISSFRALGMPIWKRTEYSWTPTTQSYNIGTGYTLDTDYPLKIYQAYRMASSGTSKIPMDVISDYDYNMLPTTTGGTPLKLTYQPKNNFGTIKLWPVPDSSNTDVVYITYQSPFEYFSASTETMDFPEEWYEPLIYGLAVRLAPEYGIPLPDRQDLRKEAQMYLDNVLGMGAEDGSIFFSPSRNW
jgi:hypothetical protein